MTCTWYLVTKKLVPNFQVKYPIVRNELLALFKKDQRDRMVLFGQDLVNNRFPNELKKRDRTRLNKTLKLLKQIKSPSAINIGLDGSRAMWIIALHSSSKQARELMLKKMRYLYYKDKNEVFYQGIPYLIDMIMIETNGKQRYGTYSYNNGDGKDRLFPIVNPLKVNERRKKYDLCPLGTCIHGKK